MLRVPRLVRVLARPLVRRFAASAPALPSVDEVKTWDGVRVVEHAKSIGLDDDDAQILATNEITGTSMLMLTEENLRADGMPRDAAAVLAASIAKLLTVTLTFKSKGGNPFPVNFTPHSFEAYVSTRSVFHMAKDSSYKRLIQTLEEAKCVKSPEYLLLATPFDTAEDLEGFARPHASGLEQPTTRSIAKSDAFIAKYGALTALADGEPVTFYAVDGRKLLDVDGLVRGPACLLYNEAKLAPSKEEVQALVIRTKMLRELLADPKRAARTSPPGMMEHLAGIEEVVPVLCGHHFAPHLKVLCRELGVIPVTTDGDGVSITV